MAEISDKMDAAFEEAAKRAEDSFAPRNTNEPQEEAHENNLPKDPAKMTEENLDGVFGGERPVYAVPVKPADPEPIDMLKRIKQAPAHKSVGQVISEDVDEEDVEKAREEIKKEETTKKELVDPFAPIQNKPPVPDKSEVPELPKENFEDLEVEDIYSFIPSIGGADREEIAEMLFNEIKGYREAAMKKYGFTEEEADRAAAARLANRGQEINRKYAADHPVTTITIDKERSKNLNFTEDEKKKLQISRAIRLVEVEDKKLRTLKSKKLPSRIDKASLIRRIDAAISNYRVPLPVMGDYAQFIGAQTVQMVSVFTDNNDSEMDLTIKKAQLCYDRFYGSASLRKFDDQNRVILSYDDFINSVPYADLDMMVYAVYVASTPEEQQLHMTCGANNCKREFEWKMNTKTLIQTKEFPEWVQKRIDEILTHTQNIEYLQKLSEDWKTEKLYESPYTGNIYAVQNPTIAKFIDIYAHFEPQSRQHMFNFPYLLMLNSIYFKLNTPDEDGNEYVELHYPEDLDAMIDIISEVPDADMSLLSKPLTELIYEPQLKIFSKCPHCGIQMTNKVELDQLVFLKAQNMSVEIL